MNKTSDYNRAISKEFDYVDLETDKGYLKTTLFNKKASLFETKKRYYVLNNNDYKSKSNIEEKKIHEFRIEAIRKMNKNFDIVISKIKKTSLLKNASFNLTIRNSEHLSSEILNLLKNQEIAKYDGVDLIDKDKLRKIQEKDFIVVMQKIILKLDKAKDFQYIYQFLKNLIDQNMLTKKTASKIKKFIEQKIKDHINHTISNSSITPSVAKDSIFELHALLAVCKLNNINLSTEERKKASKYCMKLFVEYSTSIIPNKHDLSIVQQQLDEFENIKNNIIIPIIIYNNINPKKQIDYINNNLLANSEILKKILKSTFSKLNFLGSTKSSLKNDFNNLSSLLEETQELYTESQNPSKHKKKIQKKYQAKLKELKNTTKDFLYAYSKYKHQEQLLIDHVNDYNLTISSDELLAINNYFDTKSLEEIVEGEITKKVEDMLEYEDIVDEYFSKLYRDKLTYFSEQNNKLSALLLVSCSLNRTQQESNRSYSMLDNIFSRQLDITNRIMTKDLSAILKSYNDSDNNL